MSPPLQDQLAEVEQDMRQSILQRLACYRGSETLFLWVPGHRGCVILINKKRQNIIPGIGAGWTPSMRYSLRPNLFLEDLGFLRTEHHLQEYLGHLQFLEDLCFLPENPPSLDTALSKGTLYHLRNLVHLLQLQELTRG